MELDVRPDGSGTVEAGVGLDAEALREVGDLAAALAVDDLRQAGWEVRGPRQEEDDRTWVRASKPFDHPEDLAAVAAELGPPFRSLRLDHRRSLLRTRTEVAGEVDLAGGLASFADPDLARLVDLEELRRRLDSQLPGSVRVDVAVRLPGEVESTGSTRDGVVVWEAGLGQRLTVSARSELRRTVPLVAGLVALVMAAVVGVVLVRRRRA